MADKYIAYPPMTVGFAESVLFVMNNHADANRTILDDLIISSSHNVQVSVAANGKITSLTGAVEIPPINATVSSGVMPAVGVLEDLHVYKWTQLAGTGIGGITSGLIVAAAVVAPGQPLNVLRGFPIEPGNNIAVHVAAISGTVLSGYASVVISAQRS